MISTLYECFRHWSATGSVYVISDPHFGDTDMNWRWPLIKDYPFAITDNLPSEEDLAFRIASYIIWKINSIVHKPDTLVLLGDIGDTSYVKKLKAGYKVLIKGNHDSGNDNYIRKKWTTFVGIDNEYQEYVEKGILPKVIASEEDTNNRNEVLKEIRRKFIQQWKNVDDLVYVSKPESSIHNVAGLNFLTLGFDNKLFDEVYQGPLFISDKLLLSHEPLNCTQGCYLNIHGHVHSKEDEYIDPLYFLNVAAEKCNFTPVDLKKVIDSGCLNNIKSIHRFTIDRATSKKHGGTTRS